MNAPIDKRTTTNMTSKGQVLIPKDVRDAIGLVPGRPVDVGVNDRGEAVVVPRKLLRDETPDVRAARSALLRSTQFHEFPDQVLRRALRGPVAVVPKMRIQPVAAATVGAGGGVGDTPPLRGRKSGPTQDCDGVQQLAASSDALA